jgi:hypothetical protein
MIGLRIEEDCASEVGKKVRRFAMQKFREKIEINALSLAERNEESIRFRHSKLETDEVVRASFRLLEFVPKVGELVNRFRSRHLEVRESLDLARHAMLLRYPNACEGPVDAETLLKARRTEDEGTDLWTTMNRVQENLVQGGLSDFHRDRRGRMRSVRALRGIDSKVSLNKGLWGLAERLANGQPFESVEAMAMN